MFVRLVQMSLMDRIAFAGHQHRAEQGSCGAATAAAVLAGARQERLPLQSRQAEAPGLWAKVLTVNLLSILTDPVTGSKLTDCIKGLWQLLMSCVQTQVPAFSIQMCNHQLGQMLRHSNG